jgi:hypothetical protein
MPDEVPVPQPMNKQAEAMAREERSKEVEDAKTKGGGFKKVMGSARTGKRGKVGSKK